MADSAGSDLTRHTAEVPLIDQHVHGCWLTGEPAAVRERAQ